MIRRQLLLAVGLAMILATPGHAHERVSLDADDSPGPLDVVAARLRHSRDALTLRLVTYEEWEDVTLSGSLSYIRFDFDRPKRDGIERCLVIHDFASNEQASGRIYKHCNDPLPYRREMGELDGITRPDSHTIELQVQAAQIWDNEPNRIRWSSLTSYEEEGHPECAPPEDVPPEHSVGTCWDRSAWRSHGGDR